MQTLEPQLVPRVAARPADSPDAEAQASLAASQRRWRRSDRWRWNGKCWPDRRLRKYNLRREEPPQAEAALAAGAFTVETGGGYRRSWQPTAARTGGAAGARRSLLLAEMAFRTSPGLEIWERSILVLISSLSARLGRDCLAGSLRFAGGAEVSTHLLRFVVFERTGMASSSR